MSPALRLRYTKRGKVRFISHRDVARVLERSFRRVGLPVAYTEGFSPRPRLHFGLALPTGFESDAEYLDVDLSSDVDAAGLPVALGEVLPTGISVEAAEAIDRRAVSLQADVVACEWALELAVPVDSLDAAAADLLDAGEVLLARTRKGVESTDDVRPAVVELAAGPGPTEDTALLVATLAQRTRGLRPTELVAALGVGDGVGDRDGGGEGTVLRRGRRTRQWIERDGSWHEPLRGAMRRPPDGVRALEEVVT